MKERMKMKARRKEGRQDGRKTKEAKTKEDRNKRS
jgi:hypothetical protein